MPPQQDPYNHYAAHPHPYDRPPHPYDRPPHPYDRRRPPYADGPGYGGPGMPMPHGGMPGPMPYYGQPPPDEPQIGMQV